MEGGEKKTRKRITLLIAALMMALGMSFGAAAAFVRRPELYEAAYRPTRGVPRERQARTVQLRGPRRRSQAGQPLARSPIVDSARREAGAS